MKTESKKRNVNGRASGVKAVYRGGAAKSGWRPVIGNNFIGNEFLATEAQAIRSVKNYFSK